MTTRNAALYQRFLQPPTNFKVCVASLRSISAWVACTVVALALLGARGAGAEHHCSYMCWDRSAYDLPYSDDAITKLGWKFTGLRLLVGGVALIVFVPERECSFECF